MSCPHTETTAVLAAFGEAPESFEAHLEACTACRTVVAEHTQTLATLDPVMTGAPPVRHRNWTGWGIGLLLAAAALLVVSVGTSSTDSSREALDSPIHSATELSLDTVFTAPIDSELDALEMELSLLSLE